LGVFEDGRFDSMVTDPPAGIGFMDKQWDKDKGGRDAWVEDMAATYRECLRVLKPGAHGLVWALPRTSHWTATALENAGFEIRDVVMHLFGTGFPKSLDVSKAVDKAAGAERRDVLEDKPPVKNNAVLGRGLGVGIVERRPVTDEAKQWDGWGTALKPAAEHWILVRKPLIGTVAANVLEHGTGGINVDGCRVGTDDDTSRTCNGTGISSSFDMASKGKRTNGGHDLGRWPPHVVLDDGAAAMLGDSSRFFPRFRYQAKPSTKEKSAGLAALGSARNPHPTVKPIELMRWLCRLITPPGGTVLDPFAGSGTTGCAAVLEGFDFVGIEQSEEYAEVARARIKHWSGTL